MSKAKRTNVIDGNKKKAQNKKAFFISDVHLNGTEIVRTILV